MGAMDLRALYEDWRRHGARCALHGLALRAIKRVVPYHAVYGVQIRVSQLARSDYLSADLPYATRFLDQHELLGLPNREPTLGTKFVHEALARGDRCYAILDRDRIAAYGWYSTRPTAAGADLHLHFDPAFVYMYKGFTHPDYRGQRLHGIGMARALRAVTDEGSRGIVSYVETDNVRSLRSCFRMGYRRFGIVRVLGRGEQAWIHASAGCAEYGFTLSPSPDRTLTQDRFRREAA